MNPRYVKQKSKVEYILSDLQKAILRIICTFKDADYPILQKETKRKRTTVIQSLSPLRKHGYVWIQKVEPKHTRSKIYFRPTQRGLFYAIAFLDIDPDKIIQTYMGEEIIKGYDEYIKSISDNNLRKEFLVQTAKIIMKYNSFDKKGTCIFENAQDAQEAISLGFTLSLLELAKGNNFMAASLLSQNPTEIFRKICGPNDLNELRVFLQNYRNNIDSIVKGLSD
jgi:DNA-binding PadR family transcriptional regulator